MSALDTTQVSVQASDKSVSHSPAKPSTPAGPARMVRAFPDELAQGRLSVQTYKVKRTRIRAIVRFQRQYGGSKGPEYKPVLRDELGDVVTIHRYSPEQLPSQRAIIPAMLLACLIICIDSTNAYARESSAFQPSPTSDFWAPYLLFNGALALSDRSDFAFDGLHVGLATFWSLLSIADTSQLRIETMLGLDVIGGYWDHNYLFSLGADLGVAFRAGTPQIAFFAMATWLPAIVAIQPASTNTHTTPLGYRLLIGMSWYRNNFGLGWRSIASKSGSPYRALEAFFGVGF